MIYKILPDVEIAWSDVWIGAAVTSLLFTIGKFLIGLYLGNASVGSAYGAAGSLVIILLWVYYSAQILLLGAEFTQVYAKRYASRIVPDPDVMRLTEAMRIEQGIPHAETVAATAQSQEKAVVLDRERAVVTSSSSDQASVDDGEDLKPHADKPSYVRYVILLLGFIAGLIVGERSRG